MIIQILFAILAGVLTIAAPCILPMLPVLLGASVGQQSQRRPAMIVLGFIISFSTAALLLSALISGLGLNPNLLRDIAIVCLGIFGLLLIWPKPFELLTASLSGTITAANQMGNRRGNIGGFVLGIVLGIIWTPCAGPILGSILTLAATQGSTAKSAALMAAYALGAGIPMLVIAYGSQVVTAKVRFLAQYSTRLQQIFGVLILLLAFGMFKNYDVQFENQLAGYFPQSNLETRLAGQKNPNPETAIIQATINQNPVPLASTTAAKQNNNSANNKTAATQNMPKIDFQNYGAAPDFAGISHWLNSDPLTIAQLKGKVVLVDFWTYSCINCIRTLPYVTKWYDSYRNQGFVVVGVHTPEFAFEKDTGNVQDAINRFNIHYPVAQDNDYGSWNAYQNQYWPAEYLVDQNGNIVHEHFGEGEYDVMENAIRELLQMNTAVGAENGQDLSHVNSPEMYFEPARLQNLTPDQQPSPQAANYSLPATLAGNNFALAGTWQFFDDHAQLTRPDGQIRLKFYSGKVFMVAAADHPVTLKISVDGKPQADVTVQTSQLYTLFNSTDYSQHVIDIAIPDAGFQAFTFTFG